jgi:hypothetical protein
VPKLELQLPHQAPVELTEEEMKAKQRADREAAIQARIDRMLKKEPVSPRPDEPKEGEQSKTESPVITTTSQDSSTVPSAAITSSAEATGASTAASEKSAELSAEPATLSDCSSSARQSRAKPSPRALPVVPQEADFVKAGAIGDEKAGEETTKEEQKPQESPKEEPKPEIKEEPKEEPKKEEVPVDRYWACPVCRYAANE